MLFIHQVSHFTEARALEEIRTTGNLRVSLYASSLRETIDRHRYIPYLLSRDLRIRAMLEGTLPPLRVNQHLEDFGRTAGTLIFVMDRHGNTLAASNWRSESSLVGANFNFRPYFGSARQGEAGGYYAVGMKTREPGFFSSYPVLRRGELIGVIAVKIDLEPLQQTWIDSGESIIASDSYGVLFLSTNPRFRYHTLHELPPSTARWLRVTQYLDQDLSPLPISRRTEGEATILTLRGKQYLEQSSQLLDYGWRLHYLTDIQPVTNRSHIAGIITASVLLCTFLLLLYVRERRQRLVSRRQAREADAVRELNRRLQREVDEHRATEQALRLTQRELIQAGKLAALGRMSAAITHELNQPVSAIRTFVASCRILVERGRPDQVLDNLQFIEKLTGRMAAITGQLKTFARKGGGGGREQFDLSATVDRALVMLGPQCTEQQIQLTTELPPEGTILVHGHRLEFEQVLNNLIHNSFDAMAQSTDRRLALRLVVDEDSAVLTLHDSGPGISEEALDSLFEPFYTTKEIGAGLGLGLAISYGIIREMDGSIKAANHPEGGALFTLRLPLAAELIHS